MYTKSNTAHCPPSYKRGAFMVEIHYGMLTKAYGKEDREDVLPDAIGRTVALGIYQCAYLYDVENKDYYFMGSAPIVCKSNIGEHGLIIETENSVYGISLTGDMHFLNPENEEGGGDA